jgi:hypothetical protein
MKKKTNPGTQSMTLTSVILLSLSVGLLVIGIVESTRVGIGNAYWAFMLSTAFFFIYAYRKTQAKS